MAAPKGHPPYPGCETGGRPPNYSQEEIDEIADELIQWLKEPLNIWLNDFFLDSDLNPQWMYTWCKTNIKFKCAYEIGKQKQESSLVNGALVRRFDSSFTKFVLANNHGWTERVETKLTGSAEDPVGIIMMQIDGATKDLVNDQDA